MTEASRKARHEIGKEDRLAQLHAQRKEEQEKRALERDLGGPVVPFPRDLNPQPVVAVAPEDVSIVPAEQRALAPESLGQKSIEGVLEELRVLAPKEFDYVLWRARGLRPRTALRQAAPGAGITADSMNTWFDRLPIYKKDTLEKYAQELHRATTLEAWLILQNAVADAAEVKVEGLHSADPKVAQAAASEILNRVLARPAAEINVNGVTIVWNPHKPEPVPNS